MRPFVEGFAKPDLGACAANAGFEPELTDAAILIDDCYADVVRRAVGAARKNDGAEILRAMLRKCDE